MGVLMDVLMGVLAGVDASASRMVEAYRRGPSGSQARLVERKLRRSRAGVRALQALRDGASSSEEQARDVLADELERDRRRIAFGLLVLCAAAGLGVYLLTRPEPPKPPPAPVAADRGTLVLNSGSSGDVDGSPIFKTGYADNVPDLTMAPSSFIATGGARIARLPTGAKAGLGTCAQAADAGEAGRVDGLKPGDVVCVRTSAAAVAAVTVSSIVGGDANQIYQLDIAYWSSP
jgi:hypothetical protein